MAPPSARAGPGAVASVPTTATSRIGPDQVEVFTDGAAATAALVAAVQSARASVDAEIYEFDRPDLFAAMRAALARGVRVRLVADPTVSVTVPTAHRLEAAGAVMGFFPDVPRQIDHVKLLVVDGARAFFGGYNWGAHSYLNRDYEVMLTGPGVDRLEAVFGLDLQRTGRPAAGVAAATPRPDEPHLLTSYPGDDIGRAVVATIQAARRSIEIEMFVMTDGATMSALEAAARRGVGVRILFDPGQDLNQVAMARLRVAGIRCRFYRTSGENLHAKVAVVDGEHLVLGSANWTASGFRHNHELDIVLVDGVLAGAVGARMDADWAAAE
ncbi:MAG: cardiolipin synthase [Chloroflexota bacterium]|nr:cardiolipin synthase [Chloroflexota bacterium]